MKNLLLMLRWCANNAIFGTILYFATVERHPNVGNLLIAMTAVLCYAMIAAQCGSKEQKADRRAALLAHPVPYWMDVVYDIVVIGTLVWFGWWVCSVLYTAHTILVYEQRKGI